MLTCSATSEIIAGSPRDVSAQPILIAILFVFEGKLIIILGA
jgi:hypothetical protein